MRARVLKVHQDHVILGVYWKGAWRRVNARAQVTLMEGDWIEGILEPREEDSIWLRVQTVGTEDGEHYA